MSWDSESIFYNSESTSCQSKSISSNFEFISCNSRFKVQGSLLFVTYTIIQGIISSEM